MKRGTKVELFYMVDIFFGDDGIFVVPLKRAPAGFYVDTKPITILKPDETDAIIGCIMEKLELIKNQSEALEPAGNWFKDIAKYKSFRGFSKNHFMVDVSLFVERKQFEVECFPQYKGAYVHYKGIMDDYCHKYICAEDDHEGLLESIKKAHADAKAWAER